MAVAEYPTLLSLDRYARIMGINPVHFNGAAGSDLFAIKAGCSDVWFQKSYMLSDRVARDDIALAISNAEQEIADYLGYWPAPQWMVREVHKQARFHRPEYFARGLNVRGDLKSLELKYGKVIAPGQRAVTFIGQATEAVELIWSDPDGDSFDELATITLPCALTTDEERQQIKVYFEDQSTPEWEIRPLKSVTFTGGNVVIEIDFWMLIDPAQQDAYPVMAAPTALNIQTATIYVDTVDVYQEYVDDTAQSAEFYWEPRVTTLPCPSCGYTGCLACTLTTQNGCIHVRDVDRGIAVPQPATYDRTLGWTGDAWAMCYEPDIVKVWYYAGEMSRGFLNYHDLDPLSTSMAEAIAWLATARVERNFCSCANLNALVTMLRKETAVTFPDGPNYIMTDEERANPFGTRMGEIMAWRRLRRVTRRPKVAVI